MHCTCLFAKYVSLATTTYSLFPPYMSILETYDCNRSLSRSLSNIITILEILSNDRSWLVQKCQTYLESCVESRNDEYVMIWKILCNCHKQLIWIWMWIYGINAVLF